MDLMSFVNLNLVQHLDNGQGGYVGECVSLAIRVAHDVYNVPFGTLFCSNTQGARDLFEQFDGTIPQYFDKIPNDPNDYSQLPQAGDFIIWGSAMGAYGHIGVVTNPKPLEVFQQLGTPVFRLSEIHTYPTYGGVLGWLRPKVAEVAPVEVPVVEPAPTPEVVLVATPVVETPVIAPETVTVAVTPAPEVVSVTTSPTRSTPSPLETIFNMVKAIIKFLIGEKHVL